jgi:hypothetical protein
MRNATQGRDSAPPQDLSARDIPRHPSGDVDAYEAVRLFGSDTEAEYARNEGARHALVAALHDGLSADERRHIVTELDSLVDDILDVERQRGFLAGMKVSQAMREHDAPATATAAERAPTGELVETFDNVRDDVLAAMTELAMLRGSEVEQRHVDHTITTLGFAADALLQARRSVDPDWPVAPPAVEHFPRSLRDGNRICGCGWSEVSRAHHEWNAVVELHENVLRWVEGGLEGVMALVDHFNDFEDCDPDGPVLTWFDFPEFAADHNWRNPALVMRFAHEMERLFRSLRNQRGAVA